MIFDNGYWDAVLVFAVTLHLFLILYKRRGLTFYAGRLFDILEAFQRSLLFAFLPLARRWWRQMKVEVVIVRSKVVVGE